MLEKVAGITENSILRIKLSKKEHFQAKDDNIQSGH